MVLTNIYPIENLDDLACKYRIFKVRGLPPDVDEYDRNVQILREKLSRSTKSPCEAIHRGDELYIAQPDGHILPDSTIPITGAFASIEPTDETGQLSLANLRSANDERLALRFLDFYMQSPLYSSPILWQPESGQPFFNKTPDPRFRSNSSGVDVYSGFKPKSMVLDSGRIGICVDTTHKYVEREPIPPRIRRNDFQPLRHKNCVYQWGDRWYEFKIQGLSDLPVERVILPDGSSLYDDLTRRLRKEVYLPPDGSVLTYVTGLGEIRHAPSSLCRLTIPPGHPSIRRLHSASHLSPSARFDEVQFVVKRHFTKLRFNGVPVSLSTSPMEFETELAQIPTLIFGNSSTLGIRKEDGDDGCTLEEFGPRKRQMLYAADAGPFGLRKLDRQYVVLPKSIAHKWGPRFIDDIQVEMRRFAFNGEGFGYSPQILFYDDAVSHTIGSLGREIVRTVEKNFVFGGYGLVMIPRLARRSGNVEDELANLIMVELRKRDVHVSVVHTEVGSESYVPTAQRDGSTIYQMTSDRKLLSRYRGYISNVVINKILILNSCWPFVLAKPLHADLTIGIDVKNNTAGFVLIHRDGQTFRFTFSKSDQKERLGRALIYTSIYELLKDELGPLSNRVRTVVIVRDGRVWPGEMRGAQQALQQLANEGFLERDFDCNIVEIQKTSSIPFRLFETVSQEGSQRRTIVNPTIGTYKIFGDTAYLCTTGYPFYFEGTSRPLKLTKRSGMLSIRHLVEDEFSLANLTFTRVDYCSRDPLSIKMNDIRLREIAGDYNEEAMQYGEEEEILA